MADRDNRVVAYLTDAEKRQLRDWADEVDKSQSHLVREAILEYLDHDRTARVEERLTAIEDHLAELTDTLDAETTHTHKADTPMQKATEATEKARTIVRRLRENHDEVISNRDVEVAIEDIAGVDDRTKRKYKRLFRRRAYLFEHPGETAVWTTDVDQWVTWVRTYAQLNGESQTSEVLEEYPVTIHATGSGIQIELGEEMKQ